MVFAARFVGIADIARALEWMTQLVGNFMACSGQLVIVYWPDSIFMIFCRSIQHQALVFRFALPDVFCYYLKIASVPVTWLLIIYF